MRQLRISSLAIVIGLLLALPAIANAITDGSADGDGHPSVGALIADVPGSGPEVLCSGSLIASNVFLTAGHCTAQLPGLGVDRVYVSLDSSLDRASWTLRSGRFVTDPAFDFAAKDPHDLGVVLLDREVEGVAPAQLPSAGELDGSTLRHASFTNVGYGYSGKPPFVFDGLRRVSTSSFDGLDSSMLKLSQNPGGVCFGDSGGPRLVGSKVAAVTSSGNKNCTGKSVSYRLDTPAARAFLGRFVPLP